MNHVVIAEPEDINLYRLCVLRSALKLEMTGLTIVRGSTAYARIKREFGFRGNKQRVYTQLCEYIEKQRALR